MTDDGGLNQGVSSRGGEKQIQDMFLKVEPMQLTDRTHGGPCEPVTRWNQCL